MAEVRVTSMWERDAEGDGEVHVQVELGGRSFEFTVDEGERDFVVKGAMWRGRIEDRFAPGVTGHPLPSSSWGKGTDACTQERKAPQ